MEGIRMNEEVCDTADLSRFHPFGCARKKASRAYHKPISRSAHMAYHG